MEVEEPRPGQQVIEVVLPTYITEPEEDEKFYPSQARAIAESILKEELEGKEYDEEEAKDLSLSICDRIRSQVKEEMNIPRYKVVVQVTIGQVRDQGVRVASRCLWDTAFDNYSSVSFKNEAMWCSAMIFGVYTD